MTATYTIVDNETLFDEKAKLNRIKYEVRYSDGETLSPTREVFDNGNAASVLPYDTARKTVMLVRQFRLPAALNGVPDGMLLEACAGKTEGKPSEETMRREAKEEMGFTLQELEKVMTIHPSPAGLKEKVDLFIAPYTPDMRTSRGGGLAEENEHVEVVELPFDEAIRMVERGGITDAKTVILLQYLQLKTLM